MNRLHLLRPVSVALLLSSLGIWPAHASCDRPDAVRFAPGASDTVLKGGISRGDRGCYLIGAHTGQQLVVVQRWGSDDNIVFQIYQPPWKIIPAGNGFDINGAALPGAGGDDDTRTWSGILPVSGTYLLVVGTTRGGGEYRIDIRIRQ